MWQVQQEQVPMSHVVEINISNEPLRGIYASNGI